MIIAYCTKQHAQIFNKILNDERSKNLYLIIYTRQSIQH